MTRLEELKGKIASREATIGVIGLGYVGLPLALVGYEKGMQALNWSPRMSSRKPRNCA